MAAEGDRGAETRRRAIVTGSDSGIGKATAVAFATAGFDVGVTWHEDRQGAEDTAAEVERHGAQAVVERLDVADAPAAVAAVDALIDALGGVDGFVNNAGGAATHPFLELAEHGITVNAVAPGEIATAMTGNEDVDPRQVERPMIPARRPGHAHEIAAAIVYLLSEDARYVTGESLVIDGGLTLMAAEANRIAGSD